MADPKRELTEESTEEFGELIRFTFSGFIGGLLLGALLDQLGFSRTISAISFLSLTKTGVCLELLTRVITLALCGYRSLVM